MRVFNPQYIRLQGRLTVQATRKTCELARMAGPSLVSSHADVMWGTRPARL